MEFQPASRASAGWLESRHPLPATAFPSLDAADNLKVPIAILVQPGLRDAHATHRARDLRG